MGGMRGGGIGGMPVFLGARTASRRYEQRRDDHPSRAYTSALMRVHGRDSFAGVRVAI